MDHLHDHFVTPADVRSGRYRARLAPGAGTEMLASSRSTHLYPERPVWGVPVEAEAV